MEANHHANSRRDFLRDSLAGISVGASLAAINPQLFADDSRAQRRLRLAIVSTGSRGGADPSLKNYIFQPELLDPLGYRAGSRAGILS